MESDRQPEDAPSEEEQASFADRLRALDQDAWAALYDRYHAQIWRYSFGRTSNRDAADDLAAQVFAEALASIGRYRYKGRPILAWLYAIARNLSSKHLRRARRDAPETAVEPSGDALEDRIESMVLADALGALTGEQREVVVLRFFSGCSTREIAAAMRKSEAAIYSLEVRAIGALRRQLDDGRAFPPETDKNRPISGIDKVR